MRLAWVLVAGGMLGACTQAPPRTAPSWQESTSIWFPDGVRELRLLTEDLVESRVYRIEANGLVGIDSIWIWKTASKGQLVRSQVHLGPWQKSLWMSVDSSLQPSAGGERWRQKNRECVRQWQTENGQLKVLMYTRNSLESGGQSRGISLGLPEKIFIDIANPIASEWGVVLSVPLTEPTSQARTSGCPGWDSGEFQNGIFPSLLRIAPGATDGRDSLVLTRWRLADASVVEPDTLVWQRTGVVSRLVAWVNWGIVGKWNWVLVERNKPN